jgi:hypothetical protein
MALVAYAQVTLFAIEHYSTVALDAGALITLAPRSQVPEGHLVSTPSPVSPVQRDTGPSGGWRYGARCLCWARAPSGSDTRQRVVPTDRHSFVACE